MSDFVIVTDSSADLSQEMVDRLHVEVMPLSLVLNGTTYPDYPDRRALRPEELYARLRKGEVATTSALNVDQVMNTFRPILASGRDILGVAFSGALSASCNSYRLAAEELREEFPQRKILVVDSLCASLGQGLLVWYAARKQQSGASLEETADYVTSLRLRVCHWFTVDDLHFLKRGGRVSAATALLGTMLAIKPDMHVDNEGRLINVGKSRGRQKSIEAIVRHAQELAEDPAEQTMFICHGDCPEDARLLADLARQKLGVKDIHIDFTGPVIGSHSGPGTLALFFLGRHR